MTSASHKTISITEMIGQSPVSRLLIQIGILCACVSFLDGLDSTSIGTAVPLIAKNLKLSGGDLGPIFSAALMGALFGALSLGSLGDRFGPKKVLSIATLTFGIFTFATALADSFGSLLIVRFFAGVGLGGAIPCYISLASEYAPNAHRPIVITLIYTGFPLGAIIGAFLDAFLVSHIGWRSIFFVGGILPLIVFLLLVMWLPESLSFLLKDKKNLHQVERIILRIIPSLREGMRFTANNKKIVGVPIKSLFTEGRAFPTLLLWFAALASYGTAAVVILWAPTLMHSNGISLAHAAVVLGVSGLGALIGAASAGKLIEKLGMRRVLVPALIIGALAIATVGYIGSLKGMTIDLAIISMCVGGIGGSGLLVLTVKTYPLAMRSTGVGWATGFGKFGQVLMPLLASFLIAMKLGTGRTFLVVGSLLVLGAVCVSLLQRRTGLVGSEERIATVTTGAH